MRIIFMGTPDFAVYSLDALVKYHEVIAVISQPDKPKGRGKKLAPTPVKEFALGKGLEVYQPEKVREAEFVKFLQDLQPDLIAVTAFGQILPESILNIPKFGCVNVHGSLLPKYRGAAPMQWSIIDGDEITGITTMFMGKGMDTGDMLLTAEVKIEKDDNFTAVHDKMAKVGADLLIETIEKIEDGSIVRTPQNHDLATYAPMLTKETGHIDWSKNADEIINLMRGLDPSPTAYTMYNDEPLKLFKGVKLDKQFADAKFGEIVEITKKDFSVKCKDGALTITELQARGKKRMATDAYLRGNSIEIGVILD